MTTLLSGLAVRLPLVSLLACSLGGVACTAVLGIESTELDPKVEAAGGAGGTSNGTGGQAGDTSVGGTGGAGGDGSSGSAGMTAFDPPWECVGHVDPPAVEDAMIDLSLVMINFASGMPVPGLQMTACNSKNDLNCTESMIGSVTSGADGVATLKVPTGSSGFQGYLEVTGDGFVPFLYFFDRPLVASTDKPIQFLALSNDVWSSFQMLLNLQIQPDRGQITVNVLNCDGTPGTDTRLDLNVSDPAIQSFYFSGMAPSLAPMATDAAGFGGFFNVPTSAGAVEVSIFPNAVGAKAGKTSVYLRPGYFSTMILGPNLGHLRGADIVPVMPKACGFVLLALFLGGCRSTSSAPPAGDGSAMSRASSESGLAISLEILPDVRVDRIPMRTAVLHFRNESKEPLRIFLPQSEPFRSGVSSLHFRSGDAVFVVPEPRPHGYSISEVDFPLLAPGEEKTFTQSFSLDPFPPSGGEPARRSGFDKGRTAQVTWSYENSLVRWESGKQTLDGPTQLVFEGKDIPHLWKGKISVETAWTLP